MKLEQYWWTISVLKTTLELQLSVCQSQKPIWLQRYGLSDNWSLRSLIVLPIDFLHWSFYLYFSHQTYCEMYVNFLKLPILACSLDTTTYISMQLQFRSISIKFLRDFTPSMIALCINSWKTSILHYKIVSTTLQFVKLQARVLILACSGTWPGPIHGQAPL